MRLFELICLFDAPVLRFEASNIFIYDGAKFGSNQ